MKRKLKSAWSIVCLTIVFASCQKEKFEISSKANDMFHIKNGDYMIPVLVRGNTESKKILLYVQGGPGYSSIDFAIVDFPEWKNTLEKDYAIAYYDQRGMGNINGVISQGENTMATWVEDLHKVAAFLKKRYNSEIIMLGHSFGGGLLYEYMTVKPDNSTVSRYIVANAPVTTDLKSDTLRWKFRREFLYNTANLEISRGKRIAEWNEVLEWLNVTPEIKELSGENPFRLFNKWNDYVDALIFTEYPEKTPKFREYLKIVFFSPYNPLSTIYFNQKYKDKVVSDLLKEEEANLIINKLNQINNLNILIIGSRYDDICPPEEQNYIFNQLATPHKTLKIIENAGHSSMNHQPLVFYNIVKAFVQ